MTEMFRSLEETGLSVWMRESLYALPLVNSFHLVAMAVVFGTILVVDLRLLGVFSTNWSLQRLAGDLLRWTWAAFAVSAVTGVMMFLANPPIFLQNSEFIWKLVLLVVAGLNVWIFHRYTFATVHLWDRNAPAPLAGKAAGVASLSLWVGIIILGRVIGYTKGYDLTVPPDFDFDALF